MKFLVFDSYHTQSRLLTHNHKQLPNTVTPVGYISEIFTLNTFFVKSLYDAFNHTLLRNSEFSLIVLSTSKIFDMTLFKNIGNNEGYNSKLLKTHDVYRVKINFAVTSFETLMKPNGVHNHLLPFVSLILKRLFIFWLLVR